MDRVSLGNRETSDYFIEISRGNIPGTKYATIEAANLNMQAGQLETIWDYGGLYTFLTADTQLFVSSTNALDAGVEIAVTGLDENYVEITRTATVGGQSQVPLDGDMFRVYKMFVINSQSLVGELYLAESDTVIGGVPQTPSKIKSYIPLASDGTSGNITQNGFYTVPAGKTAYGQQSGGSSYSVGKGQSVLWRPVITDFGGVPIIAGNFPLYQSTFEFTIPALALPEKTDVEFRGIAENTGTSAANFLDLIIIDN